MAGVNLIPQDVRLAQSQRRRLRGWCGVAVGALGVFALALMFDQVADAETDRVLGAHIIGPDAGTLIHEIVVGMEFGAAAAVNIQYILSFS